MYFSPAVTNLGIPSGFAKQADDYETPFLNHLTLCNHNPSSSLQILCRPEEETLTQKSEESLGLPPEIARLPQPLDDLSALVKKCNLKCFLEPSLLMETPAVTIPAIFRGAAHHHESQQRTEYQEIGRVHCEIDPLNKRAQKTPQFRASIKRRRVDEKGKEDQQLSFKGKVFGGERSSLQRESHVLTERFRRSGMNILFAKLRSLLPNTTAKTDKASIVSETINYIQSLQNQLAIHSNKHATTILPKQTSCTTCPVKIEALSTGQESDQNRSSGCDRSDAMLSLSSNVSVENLTLNYNGRDIFITINCMKKANLLPSIIVVLKSYNIQIMDAFVSTVDKAAFLCFRVKAAEILDPGDRETLHRSLEKLMNSCFQISLES